MIITFGIMKAKNIICSADQSIGNRDTANQTNLAGYSLQELNTLSLYHDLPFIYTLAQDFQ
jgi:hypothetical protein